MSVQSWSPPPNGYRVFQLQFEENDDLIQHENYCPVCFSVSRDLAVLFWDVKPEDMEEDIAMHWDVHLGELADSAENGCHFCSFMAVRFFNDPLYTFFFGEAAELPVIGCCG